MKKMLFCKGICFLLLIIISSSIKAQPAWSRGIQILPVNHDEGMRRANRALQAEGYSIQNYGGDYTAGQKGIHTAIIACNATSDGRAYINIFVASTSNDGNVPGAERVRLQAQMDATGPNIPSAGIQANWATQADPHRGKNGQRFTYYLPPGGSASGRLWGTDVYTDDSSIGTAAVHAGLISFQNGGTVTIEIRQGQSSFSATTRNGVTSNAYGSWPGSFVFVR